MSFTNIIASFTKQHQILIVSSTVGLKFTVQIEADVSPSQAKSSIILDLDNKSNVRQASVQQMFYYAKSIE